MVICELASVQEVKSAACAMQSQRSNQSVSVEYEIKYLLRG
jgi:hypothetical protein